MGKFPFVCGDVVAHGKLSHPEAFDILIASRPPRHMRTLYQKNDIKWGNYVIYMIPFAVTIFMREIMRDVLGRHK